jgi:ABC-type Fe3+-hydroxamate transport system substrate-binding protein
MKKIFMLLAATFFILITACSGGGSSATTPAASSAKAITAFSFANPAATGTITEATLTIAITVPFRTVVNALVPTITYTGASISPASGVAQDFTNPVTYTVTAADSTTQAYTVTVTVAAPSYQFVTKWGTQGSGDGHFNGLSGIAVDASGNVYVADGGNARIEVFSPQ